jgi:glutamine amidotransferase
VVVIDYGLGNLFSVERALRYVGAEARLASRPDEMGEGAVVVPGVGAFGDGMRQLKERGLDEAILGAARAGRQLLGICLGMQLFFEESDEFGLHRGLGLFGGRVTRLKPRESYERRVKVPHIGWAELRPTAEERGWGSTILRGVEPGSAMYFVHSYAAVLHDASVAVADIDFGGEQYCAVVQRDNIIGCQFHPERSGSVGLRVLRNFVDATSD